MILKKLDRQLEIVIRGEPIVALPGLAGRDGRVAIKKLFGGLCVAATFAQKRSVRATTRRYGRERALAMHPNRVTMIPQCYPANIAPAASTRTRQNRTLNAG